MENTGQIDGVQTPVEIAELQPANAGQIDWFSASQFALSALGVVGLWSSALALVVFGLAERFGVAASSGSTLATFLLAAAAALGGLLLLPSGIYAFFGLLGRSDKVPSINLGWLRPTILIFLFPLVLLLGYWVSQDASIAWLALPPLHILAIGLPVLWLLYLGIRKLPFASPQRMWGVFGSGLVLGPVLILISEVFALLAFALIGSIAIASQPDLLRQLTLFLQNLRLENTTPENVMRIFGPYLLKPVVLFAVLTFGSVVVPLLEELIKPIGVWFLIGSNLTPAGGFVAGVLSGAGYALFESLALTSNGTDWLYLVVARLGTAVIHILTAGLTGWALASSWRESRYFRLGLTYLTAVSIHGLWNGLTLMATYQSLLSAQGQQLSFPLVSRLGETAPLGLGVLALGALLVLLSSNWSLRRTYSML